MRGLSWITWVGLSQKMTVFKKSWSRGRLADTQRRKLCDDTALMWLQPQEGQGSHQELEEDRNRFSPRATRGRTVRENISIVLSHQICDNLLWQLQKTNTPGLHSSFLWIWGKSQSLDLYRPHVPYLIFFLVFGLARSMPKFWTRDPTCATVATQASSDNTGYLTCWAMWEVFLYILRCFFWTNFW